MRKIRKNLRPYNIEFNLWLSAPLQLLLMIPVSARKGFILVCVFSRYGVLVPRLRTSMPFRIRRQAHSQGSFSFSGLFSFTSAPVIEGKKPWERGWVQCIYSLHTCSLNQSKSLPWSFSATAISEKKKTTTTKQNKTKRNRTKRSALMNLS